jgi:hypothetical protein
LTGNPKGKKPLEKQRHTEVYNTKIDIKEICGEIVDCTDMTQDIDN